MDKNNYVDKYNTFEKAVDLFKKVNGSGEYNNIFVSFLDLRSIHVGPRPDGYLINQTEKGIGMLFLHDSGIAWTSQDINRMIVDEEQYIFCAKESIKKVTIKNYNLINSKVKKVCIELKGGYTFNLMVRLMEKDISYHEANFARFIDNYK